MNNEHIIDFWINQIAIAEKAGDMATARLALAQTWLERKLQILGW